MRWYHLLINLCLINVASAGWFSDPAHLASVKQAIAVPPPSGPADVTSGLQGEYLAHGNPNDSSGMGFDAVWNGTVAYGTGEDGVANHAFSLDGTESYLSIANDFDTDFGGTTSISITAWVNASTLASGADYTFQKVIFDLGADGFYLTEENAGAWACGFYDGSSYNEVTSATAYTANTWVFLAGTYNGATLKLYVNGSMVNSAAFTTHTAGYGTGTSAIGLAPDSTRFFAGRLQDLRVYNRELTSTEITALNTRQAQ